MPITSGLATIYISDMDRAVAFYTGALGMTLAFRAGNFYALVKVTDFSIALHPAEPTSPAPGTNGATIVTLMADEPLTTLVPRLAAAGVPFPRAIIDDDPVRLAYTHDPDGNNLCFVEMKNAQS